MRYYYPDFQKYNFFRTPTWRIDRARHLIDSGSRLDKRRDDELTLRAVTYLRALGPHVRPRQPNDRLLRRYPDLHIAHLLHEQGGELRWELEARLLARQTTEEINHTLSALDASVIDAYEQYFFCVRDRIEARDWVAGMLVGPGYHVGFVNDLPALWKWFAYGGGPIALEMVMAITSIFPRPHSFSPHLLRRVRRLVDVLMLPPDTSLKRWKALCEELMEWEETVASTATSPRVIIDDVITVVSKAVERPHPNETSAIAAPAPRSEPKLGKKSNRGTRCGVA